MVLNGTPFRDAYKQVGLAIEKGEFNPDKTVNHTHEGSIGNLNNAEISDAMTKVVGSFKFEAVSWAIAKLVK
jgi:argininosuccinate lyase